MIKKENQIEVIIFKKQRGKIKYLLLKRTTNSGGFWQPITGGKEKRENQIQAAKREVKEEIGTTKFKKIIERVHEFVLEENEKTKEIVFGFEVEPDVEIKKALKLLKWPQNKVALEKLNQLLEKSLR